MLNNHQNEWVTRQTLLDRAKNKDDHDAWDEFVSYYDPFVKIILIHLKITNNDLQDITQEILIKLWKSLDNFDYKPGKAKFRTWLNRVIRNSVIDFYRKNKRVKEKEVKSIDDEKTVLTDQEMQIDENSLENLIEEEWRIHVGNLAMSRIEKSFSGKAIEVFKMTLDETPTSEIAKALDLAENSVYKLKKRVEQRLVLEIQNLKTELEF